MTPVWCHTSASTSLQHPAPFQFLPLLLPSLLRLHAAPCNTFSDPHLSSVHSGGRHYHKPSLIRAWASLSKASPRAGKESQAQRLLRMQDFTDTRFIVLKSQQRWSLSAFLQGRWRKGNTRVTDTGHCLVHQQTGSGPQVCVGWRTQQTRLTACLFKWAAACGWEAISIAACQLPKLQSRKMNNLQSDKKQTPTSLFLNSIPLKNQVSMLWREPVPYILSIYDLRHIPSNPKRYRIQEDD